jgi:hypothetical protein
MSVTSCRIELSAENSTTDLFIANGEFAGCDLVLRCEGFELHDRLTLQY